MANINRRAFLRGTTAVGFLGGTGILGHLGAQKAFAADTSGYKALVCVFLKGGMDHGDTVLPIDNPTFTQLRTIRESMFNGYDVDNAASSRNPANLLQLNATNAAILGGRQIGLPSQLTSLHTLFGSGELAVVGSVGPLIEPTTRTQYEAGSVALPSRLFSHNDQQSTWMSLGVEGAQQGWGGKFADAILDADPSANALFASITASGNDVFLTGQTARQFRAPSGGGGGVDLLEDRWRIGGHSAGDDTRSEIERHLSASGFSSATLFEQDVSTFNRSAIENNAVFGNALDNAVPLTTTFPDTNLGRQLQSVAESINIRTAIGVSRQIFYTDTGGYDTHSGQVGDIPNLHTQLADAISAFRDAMVEIGEWNNVALFTASDFGRTLIDNGDGTDHGWGGHHFVAGGQVVGQTLYGAFPDADTTSEFYTESRGRLIPQVSVEQYAATLGRWFGLDPTELNAALPNLSNFATSDLGFLA